MDQAQARALLKQMLGRDAEFRDGQWEAIDQIANQRRRLLVVQRTGWGKSIVYFLATKILRDTGAGPTLLISPLLSLMRNQLLATEKLGVRAATIHSENVKEWGEVEAALANDGLDLLMVSPERLANPEFMQKLLPLLQGRVGLFVVDEAHCISDWGHDFRPDYRRIVRVMQLLPPGVPVLCTTATANDRVVRDIETQIPQLHSPARPARALVAPALQHPARPSIRPARVARAFSAATAGQRHRLYAHRAGRAARRRVAAGKITLPPALITRISKAWNASRSKGNCSATKSRRWSPPSRSAWASTNPISVS